MGKTGSIKIGFTAASAYGFCPDLVAACRTRLPEVDLSLKEMVSGDQLEALVVRPDRCRTGAAADRAPRIRVDAGGRRTASGRVSARSSASPSLQTVSPGDLDGQPFVMYSPYESRYFHDLLVTLFTRADVLPRYVQHLSQIHSILAMVRAGLGLAIVPEAATSLNFRGVELRPLRLQGAGAGRDCSWSGGASDENPLLPSLIEIAGRLASTQIKVD